MTEPTHGLRIVSLEAENVKRLRAVRVTPEGSLVVISGANGAGKSSVLDSIEMALGGKTAIPDEPIHRGKRKARIVADLGDLVVERTFTQGGSKLTVKDSDGNSLKSPQRLLDELVSRISFDPLAFAIMEPRDQDRVLRELVGVNFAELNADRKALYDERTSVNREVKRLEVRLQGMPPKAADVPEEEVSVAELLAELQRREEAKSESDAKKARLEAQRTEHATAAVEKRNQLAELEAKEAELEAELTRVRGLIPKAREQVAEADRSLEAVRAAADAHEYNGPDPEETRQQLATVEDTNRKVRANCERTAARKELDTSESKSRELTDAIEEIDQQKAETLEKAEYPIPGLGLDESGVLLDGMAFDQACTSAKIRASVAIGAALNPKLRVLLVRRGNDLDRERLREVAQMAEEMGLQVWVERIEDGGLPAVVIEDGEVVEKETAAAE